MNAARLFVGIGSPHGDDRAGWAIATGVGQRAPGALAVRCARKPVELLDWLDGVDALDICDAVVNSHAGAIRCWMWPAVEIEQATFCGTHDMALPDVLALAQELGRLPRQVRIWGVGIGNPLAFDALSPEVAAAVPLLVERICGSLGLSESSGCDQ